MYSAVIIESIMIAVCSIIDLVGCMLKESKEGFLYERLHWSSLLCYCLVGGSSLSSCLNWLYQHSVCPLCQLVAISYLGCCIGCVITFLRSCPVVTWFCTVITWSCLVITWSCTVIAWACPVILWFCPVIAWFCPVITWSCPVILWFCPVIAWFCPVITWSCPVIAWSELV